MKLNQYLITIVSVALTSAAIASPEAAKISNVEQICGEMPCESEDMPSKEEMKQFVAEKMPYLLPLFNEILEEEDEEIMLDTLGEIASIRQEYMDLNEFKPELGTLFLEVEKLDFEVYDQLEKNMGKEMSTDDLIAEIKEKFTLLFDKRIELEKGQLEFAKAELEIQRKEILELEKNKAEEVKKELEQLKKELEEDEQLNEQEAQEEVV